MSFSLNWLSGCPPLDIQLGIGTRPLFAGYSVAQAALPIRKAVGYEAALRQPLFP